MTRIVVGVDESGRGALAGPLVVSAAAFAEETPRIVATWHGLRSDKTLTVGDSKGITNPAHREVLMRAIGNGAAATATIVRTSAEIDARLMHVVFAETIRLVISRCLEKLVASSWLSRKDDCIVMVDGDTPLPTDIPCQMRAIPDGDKTVWQIGAASLVAKVTRDALMDSIHKTYPEWEFDKHRGYPTPRHKALLKQLDLTPVHRRTFKPVAEAKGLPPGFEPM